MSQELESVNLQISPDSLGRGEQAILQEIALQLYALDIFTLGQARRLANLSVWKFQQLLGQHQIQRHYDESDLAEDIESLETGYGTISPDELVASEAAWQDYLASRDRGISSRELKRRLFGEKRGRLYPA